ncbi:MAG TPA: extracellular solute-binding protein [Candidatus Binatia bacterium]
MKSKILQRHDRVRGKFMSRVLAAFFAAAIFIAMMGVHAFAQDKENWNDVVAAARKEGKVVLYGTSTFRPMVKEMEPLLTKRYGIKVEFLIARSREVRERINAEVRAKRPVGDLGQAGATSLPALWQDGGLENWLPASIKFVRHEIADDMELPKVPITPIYANLRGILVNTKLVRPGEEPKTWKDLADPKWRGKILMDDPRSAGAGNSWFVSTVRFPGLGKEFHQALAQNKPVFTSAGTYQQIANRIAQGEYAIGFPVDADSLLELKGAPVKFIAPKEGITYTVMGIGLVKNAARANAGKVFIDFSLSEEAQRVFGKSAAPIRNGIQAAKQEWSLDHVKVLPRPLGETKEEREEYYRLVESIYGIR